jgi:uncharacterized protein (TIGR03083 family)
MSAPGPIDDLAHLRADADAVLAVLAAGGLVEPVTACPGWTVRELVEHLGGVHRWAAQIVRTGRPQQEKDAPPEPADLPRWFDEGASDLIKALGASDPAAPCWSFTAARTAGFWWRRQALETAVHRWDVERAVGAPGPIDPALAAAGVTEVVELMTPRQIKLGRMPSASGALQLTATDTGDRWELGEGRSAGHVEAGAEQLLLLLWQRIDPGDPRVRTSSDAVHQVLGLALTP